MATTKKAAKKTTSKAVKKAPAATVVRSAATTQAKQQANPETSLFEVLQPFWLNGATVKPTDAHGAPVWIEMSDAEAKPYQDAGVLGTEPGEVPAPNANDVSGGQEATNASGATDSA